MAARSESHSNKWLDAIRAVWRISKQAQQARLKSHREGIGAQKPALLPRKPVVELERPDRYDHSRISEALHVLKQFVAPRVLGVGPGSEDQILRICFVELRNGAGKKRARVEPPDHGGNVFAGFRCGKECSNVG